MCSNIIPNRIRIAVSVYITNNIAKMCYHAFNSTEYLRYRYLFLRQSFHNYNIEENVFIIFVCLNLIKDFRMKISKQNPSVKA